jgi:Flp pilus assembly protein TadG
MRRLRTDERGVALVEFALVLPILMLLLFGVIEFGRAFTMWIDETHLANAAARYAAVNKAPSPPAPPGTTVETYTAAAFGDAFEADGDTQQLRDSFADPGNGVEICFPSGTGNIGDAVRIDVKAQYEFVNNIITAVTPTLTAHSVMRIESAYTQAFVDANGC